MCFIFDYVFIPSAEEIVLCVCVVCVCVCARACVWGGGIYKCFSSHMYEGKDILAQSFHSRVGNDVLVSQLHYIIAKIQHFDILRTSCALIIGEQ